MKIVSATSANESACNGLAVQWAGSTFFARPPRTLINARADAFSHRQVLVALVPDGVRSRVVGFVWAVPVRHGNDRHTLVRCIVVEPEHTKTFSGQTPSVADTLMAEVLRRCPFGRVEVLVPVDNPRATCFFESVGMHYTGMGWVGDKEAQRLAKDRASVAALLKPKAAI